MYLSKEATNENQNLQMQMLRSIDNNKKKPSDKMWAKNRFFGDQRADLTIFKPNFYENTLLHANQGTISTMKASDYKIYPDYVVLGQLIPVKNPPKGLDNYELKPNEVFIYLPQYNIENGLFQGIKKWLAYIMIRADPDKIFYSYGFDEEKSRILYSTHKLPLQNIFQGIAFKKHYSMLIDERQQQFNNFSFFLFCQPQLPARRK